MLCCPVVKSKYIFSQYLVCGDLMGIVYLTLGWYELMDMIYTHKHIHKHVHTHTNTYTLHVQLYGLLPCATLIWLQITLIY